MSLTGTDGPPVVMIAVVVLGIVAIGVAGAASEPDSNFEVTIQAADTVDTNVSAGALIEVEATVTNTGSERDSQQVHLKDFEADIVDSRARPSSTPVTLDPGEQTTVTLQWWTDEGDVGDGSLSVQSDDHTDRLAGSIQEAPRLGLESESVANSVEVGDQLEVPMRVTNQGNESVETTAWLRHNETAVDDSQLEIPGHETVEVTLTWSPTADEVGEATLTAGVGLEKALDHTVTVETVSQSRSGGGTVWVASSDDDDDEDEEEDDAEENATSTTLYPDLLQNQSTAMIDNGTANLTNSSVVQVTFEEPVSGNVSVEELRTLPNATDPINDSVVIASITVPEAANETNATIEFRLEDRNDSADERYVLNRWNGSAWGGLETETVRENKSIVVTANTPGFSIFALTNESRESETATNETTTNSTTTEPAMTTTTVPTTTTTEPEPTTTETPDPTTSSETTVVTTTDEPTTAGSLDSGLMGMIVPGLAVLGLVLVGGYFARKP